VTVKTFVMLQKIIISHNLLMFCLSKNPEQKGISLSTKLLSIITVFNTKNTTVFSTKSALE